MKNYYVKYKIDARYIVKVEADNIEGALAKAETQYMDADFGEAEDIDGEAITVEDDQGNYIWDKSGNTWVWNWILMSCHP